VSTQIKPETTTRAATEDAPYPSAKYAWYVVGVLTLVYVFSFIDRQILNLLVRPIRRDLGISDTQMSLLMGFSFAVFYTFFGIPLGRLADSRSRRGVIALGFVVWSAMTAGCGLAQKYWHMLLLRMGVGVGEAALSPAAYSLITDYFPRKRLATAISVYSMGIYIGSGLALVLGGWVTQLWAEREVWDLPIVGQTRSWQIVFYIVGLPGVLLALLMYTIKEPVRRGAKMIKTADGKLRPVQLPLSQVYDYIKQNKTTFICHNVGFALISFSNYGSTGWIPTFFYRNHGVPEGEAGVVYGTLVAVCGTLGIVAGGWLADWLSARGYRDATMRVGLLVTLLWLPTGMSYPLVSDPTWAYVLIAPSLFLTSAPFGVAPAAIQQMMPNAMRGQASAIYLFVVNLIGIGLGPTAVAMTTQYIFGYDAAVRYSLLMVATTAHVLAAVFLWMGLKPFRESMDRLKVWTAANS
jgi:MFS family permease